MSFPTDAMAYGPMGGMPDMGGYGPMGGMPGMFQGPGDYAKGYSKGSNKGQDKERGASELQKVRFRAQFAKTEMCRYYRSGCRNGFNCPYAHGDHELTTRPDLSKTSLCRAWSKNQCPLSKEQCSFAHGASDLRSTPLYEKIAICKDFTHGRCKLGASCRFAHSEEELHRDQMTGGKGMSGMAGANPWQGGKGMGHPGGNPWQNPMGPGHRGEHTQGDFVPYMMPGMMQPMPYMMQGMQGPPMPGPGAAPAPPPPIATPSRDAAQAGAEPKRDVQLMVKCKQGGSVKFKIKAAMPLRKLMDAFCARKSLQRADVRFFVADAEISPEDTAVKLGLGDDSTITAEILEREE